jgi:hypothetical protein
LVVDLQVPEPVEAHSEAAGLLPARLEVAAEEPSAVPLPRLVNKLKLNSHKLSPGLLEGLAELLPLPPAHGGLPPLLLVCFFLCFLSGMFLS